MNRRILFPVALLAVTGVVGCASDAATSNDDDILSEEIVAGAAWEQSGASEHDHEHEGALEHAAADDGWVTTPPEDSAPFFEPEDGAEISGEGLPRMPVEIDVDDLDEIKSCHRATAYRRGKAFTICITRVNGKWVEVNTARSFLRMKAAARKASVTINVVSGFRTMAEQRYLYNCYKTKRCNGGNLAAVPGYSNHQSGSAVDLNTSGRGVYNWLAKHGKAYGFRRTVPSEKWHWER